MFRLVAACLALLLDDPVGAVRLEPNAPVAQELRASYERASREAGRDADARVRLALWCERHGLLAERQEQLAIALLNRPDHVMARGLLGQIRDGNGRWVTREELAEREQSDPALAAALAEYRARREAVKDTADAHWDLAMWCEEHGLPAEARANLTRVVVLDPKRDAAWKRLGYRKVNNRWVTELQAKAEKSERQDLAQAGRHWPGVLRALRLELGDPRKRAEAERELSEVRDPRAHGSIWAEFVTGRKPDHDRAVTLLSQLDGPSVSRGLAFLAVFSPSASARQAAGETLRSRDAREYIPSLLALITEPIEYEVQPAAGLGQPARLKIKGEKGDRVRVFTPQGMPPIIMQPGDWVSYDDGGLPVLNRPLGTTRMWVGGPADATAFRQASNASSASKLQAAEANPVLQGVDPSLRPAAAAFATAAFSLYSLPIIDEAQGLPGARVEMEFGQVLRIPIGRMQLATTENAQRAEQQLTTEVQQLEQANQSMRALNERVLPLLTDLSGQDFGPKPQDWAKWWADFQGVVLRQQEPTTPSTVVEQVPVGSAPIPGLLIASNPTALVITHSCFAAGTPVMTRDGSTLIETIEPGDLVMSRDTATGTLHEQPVVAVFHNPPDRTLRIAVGPETITATPIHRFWRAGTGWVMARDLKTGDPLRTLGGIEPIQSIEDGPVQPVFNLTVAEGNSFLVGLSGVLVHDNRLVQPVAAPFDSVTEMAVMPPVDRRSPATGVNE